MVRKGFKMEEIFASKQDISEIGRTIIKVFEIGNKVNLVEESSITAQKFPEGNPSELKVKKIETEEQNATRIN